MLLHEYTLRLPRAPAAAIEEALRTTPFIRNTRQRLWMDEVSAPTTGRPSARAWTASERFSTTCRERRPGEDGGKTGAPCSPPALVGGGLGRTRED
jgi:hypothetical protein